MLTRPLLLVLLVPIAALVTFSIGLWIWGSWHDEWSGFNYSSSISDGVCNIAVIPIQGEVVSYASDDERYYSTYTVLDETLKLIDLAEQDPGIHGILIQVDSGGGSPAASLEIAERLQALEIPVATYIRDMGASAAYVIATGADTIIASPVADIGSIGITMSYLQNTLQNQQEGLEYISLSTGKFKDSGDPNKPLTQEERALFERDLQIVHDIFVDVVAANRQLSSEAVSLLADGSTLPANLALENKLIDSVGGKVGVREWFATKLELAKDDVILCSPTFLPSES